MARAKLLLLVGAFPSSALAQASFELIPPVPEGGDTYVARVSEDGQTIAGHTGPYGLMTLFRGSLGGNYETVLLDDYTSAWPYVSGVNGTTVFGAWPCGVSKCVFRWDAVLDPELFTADAIYGASVLLSPEGQIFGGALMGASSGDTFVIDANQALSFPLRTNTFSVPSGRVIDVVSHDASTAYGMSQPEASLFRWDIASNKLTYLPQYAWTHFFTRASHDGRVVTGYHWNFETGNTTPLIWSDYGTSAPHALHPSWSATPLDISSDGSRIVGYYDRYGESRVFLWESGPGFMDLETYLAQRGAEIPPGFELYAEAWRPLLSISADGQTLVGTGRLGPNSVYQGWVAMLPPVCYANCDGSTTAPALNIGDFTCFMQRFAAGDIYANCDNSSTTPYLNAADFGCFLGKFVAGCP